MALGAGAALGGAATGEDVGASEDVGVGEDVGAGEYVGADGAADGDMVGGATGEEVLGTAAGGAYVLG